MPSGDLRVVSLSHTHKRKARGSGVKPIRSLFLRNVAVFQNCVKLHNTHVNDKVKGHVCAYVNQKNNLIRLQNFCSKYKLQIRLTPDPRASRSWMWLSETNLRVLASVLYQLSHPGSYVLPMYLMIYMFYLYFNMFKLCRKRLCRVVGGLFPEAESSWLDQLLPSRCSLETLRWAALSVVLLATPIPPEHI